MLTTQTSPPSPITSTLHTATTPTQTHHSKTCPRTPSQSTQFQMLFSISKAFLLANSFFKFLSTCLELPNTNHQRLARLQLANTHTDSGIRWLFVGKFLNVCVGLARGGNYTSGVKKRLKVRILMVKVLLIFMFFSSILVIIEVVEVVVVVGPRSV